MYFRLKLQFRMADFSTLIAITGWVGLSAQYIFVPLFIKALRFHDATISLLGNPKQILLFDCGSYTILPIILTRCLNTYSF